MVDWYIFKTAFNINHQCFLLFHLNRGLGFSFYIWNAELLSLYLICTLVHLYLRTFMHYKNISILSLSLSLSLSVLSLKFSSKCHSTCPYIDRFSFGCLRIKSCKTQKCTRISQPLSVRPMQRGDSTYYQIWLSLLFIELKFFT